MLKHAIEEDETDDSFREREIDLTLILARSFGVFATHASKNKAESNEISQRKRFRFCIHTPSEQLPLNVPKLTNILHLYSSS